MSTAHEVTTGDTPTLAHRIQKLLSFARPFLNSKSIDVLADLVRPEFLQGTSVTGSAWDELDLLYPPSVILGPSITLPPKTQKSLFPVFLATPPITSPVIETLSFRRRTTTTADGVEIIDDESFCLSCPLNPTHPDQVVVTPHDIVLQGVPSAPPEPSHWWDLPWSSGKKLEKPRQSVAKKVFYPPKDAVSVLASWWGYRIFLPHSVMLKLGDDINPYADAVATITTVISYIMAHIPTAISAIPGVAQLEAILPVLSTILTAFTWEWSNIKGKDHGFGVLLAATWLLPIALWPETWDPKKWPSEPPTQVAKASVKAVMARESSLLPSATSVPSIRVVMPSGEEEAFKEGEGNAVTGTETSTVVVNEDKSQASTSIPLATPGPSVEVAPVKKKRFSFGFVRKS